MNTRGLGRAWESRIEKGIEQLAEILNVQLHYLREEPVSGPKS